MASQRNFGSALEQDKAIQNFIDNLSDDSNEDLSVISERLDDG